MAPSSFHRAYIFPALSVVSHVAQVATALGTRYVGGGGVDAREPRTPDFRFHGEREWYPNLPQGEGRGRKDFRELTLTLKAYQHIQSLRGDAAIAGAADTDQNRRVRSFLTLLVLREPAKYTESDYYTGCQGRDMAPYREQCEMKQQLPQHTHRKWPAMPSWAAEGRSDYFYIFALQELAKRVLNRDLVLLLGGVFAFCVCKFRRCRFRGYVGVAMEHGCTDR